MINLSTETLHKIGDGLLKRVLDQAIQDVHHDIAERPKVSAPRKIVLELTLKPADSGEDNINAVDVQFSVDKKLPKSTFKRRLASLPRSNTLGFEEDTGSIRAARNQKTLQPAAHGAPSSAEEGEDSSEY